MRLIDELKARDLFFATTDEGFGDFLENNKMTFYLGADPTGSSLHVGHLVTYLVAKRLQEHGHNPILLIEENVFQSINLIYKTRAFSELYHTKTFVYQHSVLYLEVKLDILAHLETYHHQIKCSFYGRFLA